MLYSCLQLNWCVNNKEVTAFRRINEVYLGYRLGMDFGAQGSHGRLHAVVLFSLIRAFNKDLCISESLCLQVVQFTQFYWLGASFLKSGSTLVCAIKVFGPINQLRPLQC